MDIQKAIERSLPILEGILSTSPDRIILYDPSGRILFLNRSAHAALQTFQGNLIGSTWQEAGIAPASGKAFAERLARVVQEGCVIRAEDESTAPSGAPEYLETILSPVLDERGSVMAVLNIIRDISLRRNTEVKLRQSEEKFERVFRLTPDAMAINRMKDGVYFDVNEAFQRITGYSREELLGKSSLELGIWADVRDRDRMVEEMRTRGSVHGLEATFLKKDGSTITGLMSGKVLEVGGERCLLTVTVDISERKRMEAALRESEIRYRHLVEQAADGIFQGAPDGAIISVNPKACEVTGRAAEELLGRNLATLFSPEELARVKFRYDLLDEGKTVVSERMLTRRDGSRVPIEMNTRRMEDGTYLSFFRDISARVESEKKLQREEAILASIIDSNPYAIQVVDSEGHHLRHNRAFLDLFGTAPPPNYSIFEDPLLGQAGFIPKIRESLGGRRIVLPDLWYDPHEVLPEIPSQRRCLRSAVFPLKDPDHGVQNLVIMHEDVTEWKLAEEALRRQEEQYRNLFFTMAQGVVYQDAEGQITSANPAAEEILGMSLEQMLGRPFPDPRWRCICEDGAPYPGELHPATVALRNGRPIHGVVMGIYQASESQYRWAVVSATPEFLHGDAKPWRVFTTLTDITELKTTQDAHRQLAQRLQGVLNNSQAIIFQIDPEGRFLLSEGLDLGILDLLPGQVVGLSALEMYRESPSTLAALKKALAGEACHAALEVRGLVFDTNLSPVFDPEGRLESVIGVSTNITERVKAERALRDSEQKFRDLLENLGEGFAFVDPDETFTFVNPATEVIFGTDPGGLVGRNLKEFLEPGDVQKVLLETNLRRAGRKASYELTIRRPNQEIRQILVNVTPIHDPRGAYLGANGLFQDITERRQAEEALRQAQKLESLGVLAGGIAHDFNNLLTAILGNLNLAQTSIPLGSAALPYLENVEKSVLRAADLTKQMLAYSGRGRFVVKVHDLNQVVQEMTTLLRVSIPKKTTLRFHLDPRTLPIEADAAQIHQVVMNLVTNASDAIGEGEGAITLATRAVTLSPNQIPSATPGQMLAPGPYAVMEVSDSGSGMSPEVRARIFDPFFTTKASGRGLGLSAMLGILRAHKAGIQIESQVGEGSTFTLFMPLAAHHHAEPAAAAAASGSRFTGEALVVDDEPTVLEFVSQALELIGFKTTTARDGAEAVEAFTKAPERFDLVLLDLTMPRMDGREALREIRLIRPEVPVILSSGFSDQEFLKETASESNLLFLQKPYQIKELKQIVLSLLRRPLS
jgi:PAS domain S-box-containing protein